MINKLLTLADNIAILAVQYTFSVIFLNISMSPSPVIPSRAFLFPGFESFMCYSDLCLWMQAYPDKVALILLILTVAGVTALWWLDEGE